MNLLTIYGCVLICTVVFGDYRRPTVVEYDFLIVGGGTAGSVLAARLTEDPDNTVLVIEAGIQDRDYPSIDVPLKVGSLANTHIDWQFRTEPMRNACKACYEKVLGGSSSINYLNCVRGSSHDFDWWESLGNKGWSYKDVLPYFKKSENNRDPELSKTDYRGVNGPWSTERSNFSEMADVILQAAEELGYTKQDYNSPEGLGWFYTQTNTRYGRRMNTALAYMWPNKHRQNLFVETQAHATKILFKDKTAIGVQYVQNGQHKTVYARKEVLLAAGTINSAHLLMLSGIGPEQHLKEHGIDVIADLPVGSGLEDHVFTYLSFTVNKTGQQLSELDYYKYLFGLGGQFASSGSLANGFLRSSIQPDEQKFPSIQIMYYQSLLGVNKMVSDGFRSAFNVDPEFWEAAHQHEHGRPGFSAFIVNLHPKTTGTVRLRNRDPFTYPVINMEYLDHPDDIKPIIEGIRLQLKLIRTKTMQNIGAAYEEPHHKGCMEYEFDSDQYWECFIRHRTVTVYHYSSTCKMSPGKDGVVDHKLRVKGINNLRVVGTAIMPHVISGNTMTATIMIAEKAADLIKEAHNT